MPLNVPSSDGTPITILAGTWNVGLYVPPDFVSSHASAFDISPWLLPDARQKQVPPDLILLGFQEIRHPVYTLLGRLFYPFDSLKAMQATGCLFETWWDPYLSSKWLPHVLESIKQAFPNDVYRPVVSSRVVGRGILAFVKDRKDGPKVTQIRLGSRGTGMGGWYGNKGAIAVSLDVMLKDGTTTSLCLVNCHMQAHEKEWHFRARNNEARYLFENLLMWRSGSCTNVQNHDLVLFLGDTNYRNSGLGKGKYQNGGQSSQRNLDLRLTLLDLIASRNYSKLLEYDELSSEKQRSSSIFHHFHEGEINFPPSYKHVMVRMPKSSSDYTKLQSNDEDESTNSAEVDPRLLFAPSRLPSYCDRILYFNPESTRFDLKDKAVIVSGYDSAMEIEVSDHKPVRAFLSLNLPQMLRTRSSRKPVMLWSVRWNVLKRALKGSRVAVFVLAFLCLLWGFKALNKM